MLTLSSERILNPWRYNGIVLETETQLRACIHLFKLKSYVLKIIKAARYKSNVPFSIFIVQKRKPTYDHACI